MEMENKERLGAEYESDEEEEEQTLVSGDVDWSKAAHDGTLDGERWADPDAQMREEEANERTALNERLERDPCPSLT